MSEQSTDDETSSTAPEAPNRIDPEWDRVFDLFDKRSSAGKAIRETVSSFARDVPIPNLAAHVYALTRAAILFLTAAEAARLRARAGARLAVEEPELELERLRVQLAKTRARLRELGVGPS